MRCASFLLGHDPNRSHRATADNAKAITALDVRRSISIAASRICVVVVCFRFLVCLLPVPAPGQGEGGQGLVGLRESRGSLRPRSQRKHHILLPNEKMPSTVHAVPAYSSRPAGAGAAQEEAD